MKQYGGEGEEINGDHICAGTKWYLLFVESYTKKWIVIKRKCEKSTKKTINIIKSHNHKKKEIKEEIL